MVRKLLIENNMKRFILTGCCLLAVASFAVTQPDQGPRGRRTPFTTDTVMVHDPVMACEDGTYYLLSTGRGLNWATSVDRKTWTVQSTPFIKEIPEWTHDSVPGFQNHVWAPDIVQWNDRWWLAYSCSTFGKNTSAIGLMSASHLNGEWQDEGCLVASREGRDQWNAIDPAFVVDDDENLWMAWGSFWDGIQMARLKREYKFERDIFEGELMPFDGGLDDMTTLVDRSTMKTIARRVALRDTLKAEPNPTSHFAGRNAIEAPFIIRHGEWYYLFASWDYCCRGAKSNYRVAVGRSKQVDGPYLDRKGKPMEEGGDTIFLEGDKRNYEAAGHCAVYDLPTGETLFICHGYSKKMNGASILIQRLITWTSDGWPKLDN